MEPLFSTISLSEVVVRAKAQLRITTSEQDAYLNMLGREALGSLNALSQLTKEECCLNITGQSAELPKNFVRYLALKVEIDNEASNDPINDQIYNGCQMMLYSDAKFLNDCGCDTNGWNNGGFQIRNNYIHFNLENTILSATLAYLGLNVDKDGNPIVFEKYERAVMSYICYMYSLSYADVYHQYAIQEYKSTWQAQKSQIIGRDAAQSFQNDKFEIQRFWGAWIVSPIINMNI